MAVERKTQGVEPTRFLIPRTGPAVGRNGLSAPFCLALSKAHTLSIVVGPALGKIQSTQL